MFRIKFLTNGIFQIFPISRTAGMVPFCNLFMERPSYILLYSYHVSLLPEIHVYVKVSSVTATITSWPQLGLCERKEIGTILSKNDRIWM